MNLVSLKTAIQQLESVNSTDEFAYENAIHAFMKIDQLPIFLFRVPTEFHIYRTRTHDSSELFTKISDISTPPNQYVKCFARCNRPFQSKFYSAETQPTSFMELVENWAETTQFGEKLYVTTGLWITKQSLNALIVTTPDIENRVCEFDKLHGNAFLSNFLNKYEGETKEAMVQFYRYLFEKFRKPAKNDPLPYIITSAYCNIALSKIKEKANCVLYPSVPFSGNGVNFAINADFIKNENIELRAVKCNEFTISENEHKKHSFTETNEWNAKQILNDQNEIIW